MARHAALHVAGADALGARRRRAATSGRSASCSTSSWPGACRSTPRHCRAHQQVAQGRSANLRGPRPEPPQPLDRRSLRCLEKTRTRRYPERRGARRRTRSLWWQRSVPLGARDTQDPRICGQTARRYRSFRAEDSPAAARAAQLDESFAVQAMRIRTLRSVRVAGQRKPTPRPLSPAHIEFCWAVNPG